jgi:hypothetical protein
MASALGRTCKMRVFSFNLAAVSTMLRISCCCCALLKSRLLGQSIFVTVETHAARISRGAAGAAEGGCTGSTLGNVDVSWGIRSLAGSEVGASAELGLVAVLQALRFAKSRSKKLKENTRFGVNGKTFMIDVKIMR